MIAPLRGKGAKLGDARAERVGVAVQGSAVRVVGVRASRGGNATVCWAIEGELESDETIAGAVRELLAGAPLRRWPVPGVVVAVGGHAGQVKPLHGLPATMDAAMLAGIVGASPQRFFLRNGVPVVAGGVRVDADGALWGTAFAAPLAGQVADAVRQVNGRLLALTTLPVALSGAVRRDGPEVIAACEDEDGLTTSRYLGGRFAGVLRGATSPAATSLPTTSPLAPSAPWTPGLAALGDGATRFAAAYGAAVLPADEPLVLRPAAERDARARRRLGIAAAAAVGAIAFALAAPLWRAAQLEQQAQDAMAARGPRYAAALRDEARLAATDATLRETAAWDARRISRLQLLERLTAALPGGAALVSLRADTAEVSLVVVAPRMATVTAALERAKELTALSLVGAVSREVTGGRELERATYNLRLAGGAR